MRRETTAKYIIDLWRAFARAYRSALEDTFIVGFPGETEAHYGTLLHFIETSRFERLAFYLLVRKAPGRSK